MTSSVVPPGNAQNDVAVVAVLPASLVCAVNAAVVVCWASSTVKAAAAPITASRRAERTNLRRPGRVRQVGDVGFPSRTEKS